MMFLKVFLLAGAMVGNFCTMVQALKMNKSTRSIGESTSSTRAPTTYADLLQQRTNGVNPNQGSLSGAQSGNLGQTRPNTGLGPRMAFPRVSHGNHSVTTPGNINPSITGSTAAATSRNLRRQNTGNSLETVEEVLEEGGSNSDSTYHEARTPSDSPPEIMYLESVSFPGRKFSVDGAEKVSRGSITVGYREVPPLPQDGVAASLPDLAETHWIPRGPQRKSPLELMSQQYPRHNAFSSPTRSVLTRDGKLTGWDEFVSINAAASGSDTGSAENNPLASGAVLMSRVAFERRNDESQLQEDHDITMPRRPSVTPERVDSTWDVFRGSNQQKQQQQLNFTPGYTSNANGSVQAMQTASFYRDSLEVERGRKEHASNLEWARNRQRERRLSGLDRNSNSAISSGASSATGELPAGDDAQGGHSITMSY